MKLVWPFTKRRKPRPSLPGHLRARYDAAQTTVENARHWAMADGLSPDAAATPDVRRTLRNRARYEVANNSYAKGIVLTIAGDCVGTGPRLQLLSEDNETNRIVEQAFGDWALAVDLAAKLRTMRMAKATDGEAFAVFVSNPDLDHPVKLDLRPIEADRVASPPMWFGGRDIIDGIELDELGNPTVYHVMKGHPGDTGYLFGQFARISAAAVVHWYRADRPSQHRGVPEITPALPLFAQLRRYTLAVLGAAETAADFAAVLYTDAPAGGEATPVEPLDVIELEKRMATTLPDGWKLGQIKAEQPGTAYAEFKREILGEIGRCLQVPINVVTGDSSQHNYASGRLDHQTYFKSLRIEQAHLGRVVMDRIFSAWIAEAALLQTFAFLRALQAINHQWFWDGMEHVDPAKEANAQATRLATGTTTLAYEYARQGKDWEAELRQRAKEKQLMRDLGLTESELPAEDPPEEEEDAQQQQAA